MVDYFVLHHVKALEDDLDLILGSCRTFGFGRAVYIYI